MLLRSAGGTARLTLLLLSITSIFSVQAKDVPRIEKKKFDTLPFDVKYFEDSDVILAQEESGYLWRSDDGGLKWHKADDVDQGDIASFWMNPNFNDWAYALGRKGTHWVTKDKGKSWKDFELPDRPTQFRWPLSFHAFDPEKVIVKTQQCEPFGCQEQAYYTTDGFDKVAQLKKETKECIWAASNPQSTSEDKKKDSRILCIVQGDNFGFPEENRLQLSDDYFKTIKEPIAQDGRKVKGFVNIAAVKGYIIAAAKAEGSTELSLIVSTDGDSWHSGIFPSEHKVHEEAYTVMESTDYSIQVDVVTGSPWGPMGNLFASDSNGTYFTKKIEHTNRSPEGIVDFEKIQGIQGIVMVNTVKNAEDVARDPRTEKQKTTKISFDDGVTWTDMKDTKGKTIHLHSVTEMSNSGKVFSSPAPGLVMGVGNTGEYLKDYSQGDLFVSDDAGLTWSKALSEAHKYEFGDQGTILTAVYDEGPTNEIKYSLNHGKDWETVKIDDTKARAGYLMTIPDSTTQKFIYMAIGREDDESVYYIYTLDFTGIYKDKCEDDDFEDWHARLDADGKPDCLMGHKQSYRRRKKDAKCYVGEKFKEAKPIQTNCECTVEDFECAYGFVPEGDGSKKQCLPKDGLQAPAEACKNKDDTFKTSSGFRLIPGNTCKDGVRKDKEEVEHKCGDTKAPEGPIDGKVKIKTTTFRGNSFEQKVYLERSGVSTDDDDTIVMSIGRSSGSVAGLLFTRDHGKTWNKLFDDVDEDYQLIVKHQYQNDRVFFISPRSKKIRYSVNRLQTYNDYFDAPAPLNVNGLRPLVFHPDKPDSMLWAGSQDCSANDRDCHTVTHISQDRGAGWKVLARYSGKCEFIERKGRGGTHEDLLYCEQKEEERSDGKLQLRATEDLGGNFETKVDDILAFATMSEFIVVAQKDPKENLKITTSIDGHTFADASWPHNFDVPHRTAYTVLDSSTHAVFMHVTTSSTPGFEYGKLVKSNSNGTFYITALDHVNRGVQGYVDFEKMQGVDGVAMVNVVANPDDADSGKAKKLRSLISHNDGAQWASLKAPEENPEGDGWDCDVKDTEKCSLHLHSYTERDDATDTFSSKSATGLMVAVGNVGEYLGDINDKDNIYTFITRDAGITWKVAKKGRFMWEYGDQGSLIVIVERGLTNVGYYTSDEGASWSRFEFENKITVTDLTTTPSDNSKQFIVWFRNGDNEVGTINLDFSSTRENKMCNFKDDDHGNDDYELWTPKHPMQKTDCLFGKKMQYIRKKPEAQCWNGYKLDKFQGKAIPCECTRQDFECDFNFVRTADDVCQLVPGLEPINHAEVCAADSSRVSYYEPKGYRKLAISDCEGGEIHKFLGEEHRCPGHEDDVIEDGKKGLSGFWFFLLAIVLPIAAAAGIGYLVWQRIQSGAGFGRIRLGESSSTSALDSDQPWIKYPVAAVSALVAVVLAIPMVIGAGWRAISSRFGGGGRQYTSRQSFARGRGDYSIVEDEDELLGDDEEEA